MARKHDLLTEIESGALDPRADLPDLLRRCLVLGGRTGSQTLRQWASRELKGYDGDAEVPSYRHVEAPLLLDGIAANMQITGQAVHATMIPDFARDELDTEVPFRQPIAEINEMLKSARADGGAVRLGVPGGHLLVPLMNSELGPGQHIDRIYWSVSHVALSRIIDVVRTILVELVAEMRAGSTSAGGLPTQQLADQAVAVAINGSRNRVTINQIQELDSPGGLAAMGDVSVGAPGPESFFRRFGWWLFGAAGVVAAVAAVLAL